MTMNFFSKMPDLNTLSQLDLGSVALGIVNLIGFFLFVILIIRSIEIPVRIYLDKRKKSTIQSDNDETTEEKGF